MSTSHNAKTKLILVPIYFTHISKAVESYELIGIVYVYDADIIEMHYS